jgi:hypothetical protein
MGAWYGSYDLTRKACCVVFSIDRHKKKDKVQKLMHSSTIAFSAVIFVGAQFIIWPLDEWKTKVPEPLPPPTNNPLDSVPKHTRYSTASTTPWGIFSKNAEMATRGLRGTMKNRMSIPMLSGIHARYYAIAVFGSACMAAFMETMMERDSNAFDVDLSRLEVSPDETHPVKKMVLNSQQRRLERIQQLEAAKAINAANEAQEGVAKKEWWRVW